MNKLIFLILFLFPTLGYAGFKDAVDYDILDKVLQKYDYFKNTDEVMYKPKIAYTDTIECPFCLMILDPTTSCKHYKTSYYYFEIYKFELTPDEKKDLKIKKLQEEVEELKKQKSKTGNRFEKACQKAEEETDRELGLK